MDKEHLVPLSRQALGILEEMKKLTANRKFVFSCAKDAEISDKHAEQAASAARI